MSLSSLPQLGPVPDALMVAFEEAFAVQQRELCQLWKVTAQLWAAAAEADRAFVGDELALTMGVHPQTASALVERALRAQAVPALLAAWEALELTDRHVLAAIDELDRCLDDPAVRIAVVDRVLTRCRERAREHGWPRPGELRRMIRAAALLHDPAAAERRERSKRDDRRTDFYVLPDGQAGFALEGPAASVLAAAEAIRIRAKAIHRLAGEQRTVPQIEFDLTVELLTTGTLDGSGPGPVVEIQVVVPLDVATAAAAQADRAGDGEEPSGPAVTERRQVLAELVGYGPITDQTARELIGRASMLRRIVTGPNGQVIAVDDARTPTGDLSADLKRLAAAAVVTRDLSSRRYRATRRQTRFVRTRDRTCRFPCCTTPARWTDLDHRLAWPHGPTDTTNLHCLCRHHHRAKQSALFTVSTDPAGNTTWTSTRTGRTHTTPAVELTPA